MSELFNSVIYLAQHCERTFVIRLVIVRYWLSEYFICIYSKLSPIL